MIVFSLFAPFSYNINSWFVKKYIFKNELNFLSPRHIPGETKKNDKKPSNFQFYFSGVLEAFSMLKKWKQIFASLDFGDNPIYPISNPDGQDREV